MSSLITKFDEMDGLFNQLWRSGYGQKLSDQGDAVTVRPRVDIYESDREFVIEADLPGVRKDDLSVEVERNVLTISAERKSSREDKPSREDKHEALHIERYARARFERSFRLGEEVDAPKIAGELENGVLRLIVPKQEKALPRRIEVK